MWPHDKALPKLSEWFRATCWKDLAQMGDLFVFRPSLLLTCNTAMMTRAVPNRWPKRPSWTIRWLWKCKSGQGYYLSCGKLSYCREKIQTRWLRKQITSLLCTGSCALVHWVAWELLAMGSFALLIQELQLMVSSLLCGFQGHSLYSQGRELEARK